MPEAVVVTHELTKRYRYLAAVAGLSFVLGLATAIAFQRGGSLVAAMVAHALYNGAVIAIHHFMPAG